MTEQNEPVNGSAADVALSIVESVTCSSTLDASAWDECGDGRDRSMH